MRRRSTLTVGFIVDDIANPLPRGASRRPTRRCASAAISLYLVNTNGTPREEAEAIDMLQHGRADGLIMTINSEQDPRTLKRLAELRVPRCCSTARSRSSIDAVLTDHAARHDPGDRAI